MKKRMIALIFMLLISILLTSFVSAGLFAYYPLDGNANDNTANGNNGVVYGGVSWPAGKIENAVYLNGSNYIDVPNKNYLKLNSSNYLSVGVWVYLDSSDTDGGFIISKPWNGCGDYIYYIQAYSPTDNRVFIGGGTSYNSLPMTIPRDSWHYVAFTVNNTYLNVYVDGVLTSSGAHGITSWTPTHCSPVDGNTNLAIGTLYPYKIPAVPSTHAIKGSIDELRIWNYALTPEEIKAEYDKVINPKFLCTDSDNGKNYEVKGTIKSGNVESTDYCKNEKTLEEYYCFDGVESESYECSYKCEEGICVDLIEILDEYTYVNPDLVEEGQNITFYHRIKINNEDLDFAPESYLINIKKAGETKSIEVFKESSNCGDPYCYVRYYNTISNLPAGDYKIIGESEFRKFKILKKGWFNENLVLDEKFGNHSYFGFYDPHNDYTHIMVIYLLNKNMESPGNKIAGLMILNDSLTTNKMFDMIFNEFFGEIIKEPEVSFQTINLNENNIYLFQLSEERSNFRIVVAFWRGENYITYVAEILKNKEKREMDITEEEFMRGLMGRGHSYKREEVSINDFSELGKELVEKYLEKWESTLAGEPVTCIPNWQCSLTPLICPEYGRQTETCNDVNECAEFYKRTIECQPGLCSGCLHDGKCIPYGSRFQSEEVIVELSSLPADVELIEVEEAPEPASEGGGGGGGVVKKPQKTNYYCDIDGRIKRQKGKDYQGNWAKCQNNYECESNFCSSGECIEITQMMQKAKGFKAIFVKVFCKLAHLFNIEKYNQCIINWLGEENLDESLTITIINPIDNSTITKDSILLNITTNKNAVCEYGLGHGIIISPPPCEEGEPCKTGAGGGGASKPKKMSMTSGTNHLQLITGLKETINNEIQKEWYFININCKDNSGKSKATSIRFYVNLPEESTKPECGDGVCNVEEDYDSCPTDCGNVYTNSPNVILLSPFHNKIDLDGNITFVYNVTVEIENCSLIFDGVVNQTDTSINSSFIQYFSLTGAPNGDHNWSVKCVNESNHKSNSEIRTILVLIDTIAPIVTLNGPADGSKDSDGSVKFNFTVTDNGYITNCSLYTNINGIWQISRTNTFVQPDVSLYFTLDNIPDDTTFKWNVVCYDFALNANHDWGDNNWTIEILF